MPSPQEMAQKENIICEHKGIQREREEQQNQAELQGHQGFCLLTLLSATVISPGQEQQFQDCAEVHRAGIRTSGIYTLNIANLSKPKKVSTVQRGLPCSSPECCPPSAHQPHTRSLLLGMSRAVSPPHPALGAAQGQRQHPRGESRAGTAFQMGV